MCLSKWQTTPAGPGAVDAAGAQLFKPTFGRTQAGPPGTQARRKFARARAEAHSPPRNISG